MKPFEEIECDDIKHNCPWVGGTVACYGGRPIMCEGRFCQEAYKKCLEEEGSEVEG